MNLVSMYKKTIKYCGGMSSTFCRVHSGSRYDGCNVYDAGCEASGVYQYIQRNLLHDWNASVSTHQSKQRVYTDAFC